MRGPSGRFGSDLAAGSDYTAEEIAFMLALDRWKRATNTPHPSWKQILRVAIALGYRRVAAEEPLPLLPAKGSCSKRRAK
jgi:hypothetical protein